VVTPAKNNKMLRNKLTSQNKSSCDNQYRMHGAKRNNHMSGISRSITKAELSNTKDESRYVKSTDSRGDSNPGKKAHTLTKQDSSKYLKNGNPDKVLKRAQRTGSQLAESRMKT
jgi:hypothetical protein